MKHVIHVEVKFTTLQTLHGKICHLNKKTTLAEQTQQAWTIIAEHLRTWL